MPAPASQLADRLPRAARTAARRVRAATRDALSVVRLLPDYLVVGAQRAGSTSLHSWLTGHPHVGAPSHKEIHFFDLNFHRSLSWYRAHFPTVFTRELAVRKLGAPYLTGEASPYYLFHPHVPARVAATLPAVRVLVLLRNPVERAYSHYQHMRREGHELLSFREAVEGEPERLEEERRRIRDDPSYTSLAHRRFSYVERGVYADQLERWFAVLPRERILVLESEKLFADTNAVYGRVLDFLGLPPCLPTEYRASNVAAYDELDPEARGFLEDYYRPHNERLSELLGRRLGW